MKNLKVERVSLKEAQERFRDYLSDMGTDDVADVLLDPAVKNGPAWLFDQLSYGEDLGFIEVPDDKWLKASGKDYFDYVCGEQKLQALLKSVLFFRKYAARVVVKALNERKTK